MEIKPIAYIKNQFKEKFGIPRQSGRAPSVISKIIFEPEFNTIDAVRGLEGFSHVWLIFGFSKAEKDGWSPLIRPPRLGGNTKVGVFASRSPFRPNRLGLSSVKLINIETDKYNGVVLTVSGADLLDGTPVYDIKPYLPFTDCHADATGGYASEKEDHKLKVVFPEILKNNLSENDVLSITECLADDPRPSYQEDGRLYGMRFGKYNIKFKVEFDTLTVFEIENV